MKNAFKPTRTISDHEEHYFSSYSPTIWTKYGFSNKELKPFMAPNQEIKKIKLKYIFLVITNFGIHRELLLCTKNTGFKPMIKDLKEHTQNTPV